MDWDWGSKQTGSGPALYQSFMAPGMFQPFAEVLVEALRIEPGERVLDLACGTGVVSRAAAFRAGTDGSVTGVDLGAPMLEVARSQPAGEGAAEITYLEGSADSLPVGDQEFDVVLCQQGFQFFPDRPAALGEMRRALLSGGRLGITTWAELERNPVIAAIATGLAHNLGEEVGQMMHAPFSLHDPDELHGLAEDAGFTDVEVRERTMETSFPSHQKAARTIVLAGPIAPTFSAAPEENQRAYERETTESLAGLATDDGGLRAPMTTLELLAVSP